MPNNLEVSDVVAATLGLIERDSVLSRIAYRDAEEGFSGGTGSSVRVRIPRPITARNGAEDGDTVFSGANEDAVTVELSHELYSAVPLADRELTLDLYSYARQVLEPQTVGLVRTAEQVAAEVINEITESETGRTIDPDNPLAAVREAAATFVRRENGDPEKFFVIGPDLVEPFLADPAIRDASAAGDDRVIQTGHIGTVHGMAVHVSPYLTGAVAMTHGAFAMAVRAPAVPEGAEFAESGIHQGYSVRYLRQFEMATRSEVSLISAFVGATALDEERLIPFNLENGESS